MQGSPLVTTILMYVAIGAIFYFILLRPQQKQRKAHEEMIRTLKKGDEIVTAGGVVGEVVHIAQQTKEGSPVVGNDDRITIRSAESRLIIERGRITKVSRPNAAANTPA